MYGIAVQHIIFLIVKPSCLQLVVVQSTYSGTITTDCQKLSRWSLVSDSIIDYIIIIHMTSYRSEESLQKLCIIYQSSYGHVSTITNGACTSTYTKLYQKVNVIATLYLFLCN